MSEFADVTELAGLPFIAKSGNTGIITLLGEHGLRMGWDFKPSAADIDEFEAFVGRRRGGGINVTRHMEGGRRRDAIAEAHRAYRRFLDQLR